MADPAASPIVSVTFQEPEQMAEVLALHDLDVLVLSRPTRAWEHVTVRLGPLTLDWGYTPARILARGATGPAAAFNFATASRDEAMLWNGHLVGRNEFIGSSARADFAATTGVSTHVALFAEPEAWSAWLTPLLGVEHWTFDPGCSLFRADLGTRPVRGTLQGALRRNAVADAARRQRRVPSDVIARVEMPTDVE